MDIDYGKVCEGFLDSQRESRRRESRQEEKFRVVVNGIISLLANIDLQGRREIITEVENTEGSYIKNELTAKLKLSVAVNNKAVSLCILILVPEDEVKHPNISFVHNSDVEYSSEYSENNVLKINRKIIEELRFLLSSSDRVI
jgi:hypothetical protein